MGTGDNDFRGLPARVEHEFGRDLGSVFRAFDIHDSHHGPFDPISDVHEPETAVQPPFPFQEKGGLPAVLHDQVLEAVVTAVLEDLDHVFGRLDRFTRRIRVVGQMLDDVPRVARGLTQVAEDEVAHQTLGRIAGERQQFRGVCQVELPQLIAGPAEHEGFGDRFDRLFHHVGPATAVRDFPAGPSQCRLIPVHAVHEPQTRENCSGRQ